MPKNNFFQELPDYKVDKKEMLDFYMNNRERRYKYTLSDGFEPGHYEMRYREGLNHLNLDFFSKLTTDISFIEIPANTTIATHRDYGRSTLFAIPLNCTSEINFFNDGESDNEIFTAKFGCPSLLNVTLWHNSINLESHSKISLHISIKESFSVACSSLLGTK